MSHSKYKNIADSEEYKNIKIQTPTDLSKVFTIKNFSAMICAKRRTGKSVFMKDLLSQIHKNYADCYLFSMTIEYQKEVYEFVREENRILGFNEKLLQDIYDKQGLYIKKQLAKKPDNISEADYKAKLDHIMIIFDDIISDDGVRYSKVFKSLFILARHMNIAVICLSQYYSSTGGLSRVARTNLDYLVSFYLDSQSDKEHLVDDFMSKTSRKEGLQLYTDICTEEDHQAIILCNSVLSINYEDYVFRYVARLNVPKFEMASKIIDTEQFIMKRENQLGKDSTDPLQDLVVKFGKQKPRSLW